MTVASPAAIPAWSKAAFSASSALITYEGADSPASFAPPLCPSCASCTLAQPDNIRAAITPIKAIFLLFIQISSLFKKLFAPRTKNAASGGKYPVQSVEKAYLPCNVGALNFKKSCVCERKRAVSVRHAE